MSTGSAIVAGKKRKRYTPVEKDISVKLTGKLHHGFKEVRKAVKKAKTFETQKLVKKLKDLRTPAQNADAVTRELSDLEIQLESLKRIDQEHIALVALSSKIRKDKTLSSNKAITSALDSMTPTSPTLDAIHAKVESRLLSSKLLAGEVGLVLSGLKAVLEPKPKVETDGDPLVHAKAQSERAEGGQSEAELSDANDSSAVGSLDAKDAKEFEGFDDVVDDDGWESGSVHSGDGQSSDNDISVSSVPPHKRSKQASPQQKLASSTGDTSEVMSTFLPSLSVGFIQGDPESDVEESESEVANTGRKNRRGQRARQAIWEKKYGKNAKHVKTQREEAEAVHTAKQLGKRLDRGWDGQNRIQREKSSRGPKASHPVSLDAERPTHPSWEAKKKLKEKEGAKILKPQGKKIVFA